MKQLLSSLLLVGVATLAALALTGCDREAAAPDRGAHAADHQ